MPPILLATTGSPAAAEHAERHFDGTRNFHALLDQLAEIATREGRA
jgi:hypothetical protein